MALGNQAPGTGGEDRDTTGLSNQAPGEGGFGGGREGLTNQQPGLDDDSFNQQDSALPNQAPGETVEEAQMREFSEFSSQLDSFIERVQFALGFGPDITGSVKRGAQLTDPASFARGVKTGVGFELAQSFAGLSGLPTSAAVGILDRVVSAAVNPAFAAGRSTVSNPLGAVAPVAGAAAGFAGRSVGLAKAVELGLNVAGVTTQFPDELREQTIEPQPRSTLQEDSGGRQVAQAQETRPSREPALGAVITSETRDDFERLRRSLTTREALGRAALTVGRA